MATTRPPAPRLGEIWLTAFGAARAGEPGKTRPALVLSANGQVSDSVYDLVMVAPLSATLEPTAARPRINATAANGLDTDSVVVARALRAVSTSRLVGRLGVAETAPLHATRQVVAALLDLG
ncbi:MAG: type II toxin-antitoxin system PemK/MazF family toxin [Bifidobacteriaceae bacterium]|nr:type II toxin-antitoxin system PemK/MazF family toxin [Bifidobacteriaceae bacterium]